MECRSKVYPGKSHNIFQLVAVVSLCVNALRFLQISSVFTIKKIKKKTMYTEQDLTSGGAAHNMEKQWCFLSGLDI